MFRSLMIVLLLVAGAFAASGSVQATTPAVVAKPAATATAKPTVPSHATATPASVPTLTDAQINSAIATLKDTTKRDALIATLEAMKKGTTSAAPAGVLPGIGIGISQTIERKLDSALAGIGSALKQATDVSLIWHWLGFVATNVWLRHTVIDVAWRLALVLAAALLGEYLARRALRRPRAALLRGARRGGRANENGDEGGIAAAEAGQTEHPPRRRPLRRLLRRLPGALGHFLLELVPVLGFALIGLALLSVGLAPGRVARLVIIAALETYLISRVVMEGVRLLVAPATPDLRLIGIGDHKATWLTGWLRIITNTIAFSYVAITTGGLFGLYPAASQVLLKLVSLAVHIMVAIMVLQARRPVATFIRGDRPANSFIGALRAGLARSWHILALFYVIALWIAWAAGVPHAFFIMLRIVVVLGIVIALARGIAGSLESGLNTLFDDKRAWRAQHPGLHARMRLYLPVFRLALGAIIALVALLAILQLWGFGVLGWFAGTNLGRQFLSASITIGAAILIALFVWEAANTGLEAHAERLSQQGREGRAARYRTLLPMVRSTLLVIILVVAALVVLSAIGVNVTLLLGGLSIFGLAIGFGSQKLVQDIITGLFLLLEDAVQVGDWVTLGGVSGTVETLSIRTIRLRAGDGSLNVIPFSAVSTVANYSREFSFAPISIGVAYKEDIDRVFAVVRDEFEKMRAEPEWGAKMIGEIELWGLDQFGASSLDIVGRMRTLAGQQHAVRREFNRRIKIRFDAEEIEIPFPYQRLTIDPAEFRAAFVRDAAPSPAPASPNS